MQIKLILKMSIYPIPQWLLFISSLNNKLDARFINLTIIFLALYHVCKIGSIKTRWTSICIILVIQNIINLFEFTFSKLKKIRQKDTSFWAGIIYFFHSAVSRFLTDFFRKLLESFWKYNPLEFTSIGTIFLYFIGVISGINFTL